MSLDDESLTLIGFILTMRNVNLDHLFNNESVQFVLY